jgi:hypothetical protein
MPTGVLICILYFKHNKNIEREKRENKTNGLSSYFTKAQLKLYSIETQLWVAASEVAIWDASCISVLYT